MGYALLQVENNKCHVLEMGVVKMAKLPDHHEKLKKVFEATLSLVNRHHPDVLAVEAPFYGKNPQSMLKLGRAQGVIISVCMHHNMQVFEYAPRKIKQAITGKGSASKEQVKAMLYRTFPIEEESKYLDATDALAAAYCHHLQNRISFTEEKFTGWESFLAKNKDRIIEK
jgi:crossover junction endodeoxyribonuclease RuvC